MFLKLSRLLALLTALACAPSLATASSSPDTQALLHALDYLAVDYPGVVVNGAVTNAREYAEQREFAEQVIALSGSLPAHTEKDDLLRTAHELGQAIERRAPGAEVRSLSRGLAATIIRAYQVAVTPPAAPSVEMGRALYAEQCAACHGATGYGDGPRAATLQPTPINFHDGARQSQRSPFSLYSTISLGIAGTPMPAFTQLNEMERWALAFYVSNFFASDAQRARGESLWQEGQYRTAFSNLTQLAQAMPANVAAQYGDDGVGVLSYLRANPRQLDNKVSPLATAQRNLSESAAAYETGDRERAYNLAVSAYLEGFELTETSLNTVNPALKHEIESAMTLYRQAVKDGAAQTQISAQAATLHGMLNQASAALNQASQFSPAISFVSSLVILLREGVEAFLVLAAIVAFLIKTGRRDALIYVHMGWIAALIAGVATWFVTKSLIAFGNQDREVVEGVVALIAAGMLLYVGYWLHNHSHAQRWKQFVHARIGGHLSAGSVWGLSLISFIAVYREVAETVLFYEALWLQAGDAGHGVLLGGIVTAALILLALAWLMFRLSVRLPLQLFFRVNAAILVVLAIVFAGKGVAALQEAGKLRVDPIAFPEIDLLGVHANLEGLGLQLTMIIIAIAWLIYARLRNSRERQ